MEMLVTLLRVAWIAATLPILAALLPSARLSSYRGFILGFAKRGKTMQSSAHRFTVPQKFFVHFYILAVLWTAILILTMWFYAYKMTPSVADHLNYSTIASHLTGGSHVLPLHKASPIRIKLINKVYRSLFLLFLMEVQVSRRLYETIFVFNYSPSARMHIMGYLTGLFYYTAAPLSLCCVWVPEVFMFSASELANFMMKRKNQVDTIDFDWLGYLNPLMKLGECQWIGAAIFFWGWAHQHRCHAILGSLRKQADQINEYMIPHGDWFRIISSPHYLAEIVIYSGLVVASGGTDITIWLLFGFVVANLAFAAAETHRWYLHKFDNYPRDRYAVIPSVY